MSAGTLASASGEAAFSVVRTAGTFKATGHFSAGSGAGTYTFEPSAVFRARIRALGNGTPTDDQLFALTIADFQGVELDELAAHGYSKPTPDELARLAEMDANPSFVFAAVALPAKTKTVSQLLALAQRGIRADDIATIERYGYHPTLGQTISRVYAPVGTPIRTSTISSSDANGAADSVWPPSSPGAHRRVDA
jgi:hypothetical protein